MVKKLENSLDVFDTVTLSGLMRVTYLVEAAQDIAIQRLDMLSDAKKVVELEALIKAQRVLLEEIKETAQNTLRAIREYREDNEVDAILQGDKNA